MDRAGKRHPLRHVWFEEWMVTLRRRLCSGSEEGRRYYYTRVLRKAPYHGSLHVLAHQYSVKIFTLRRRLVGQEIQMEAIPQ